MEEVENRLPQKQKDVIRVLLLSQQAALNSLVASRARKFKFLFEYADSVFVDYVEEFISTHILMQRNIVEKALKNADSELFGICVICRKPIPFERLMAMPTAAHCVQCAADNDRYQRRLVFSKSPPPRSLIVSF